MLAKVLTGAVVGLDGALVERSPLRPRSPTV